MPISYLKDISETNYLFSHNNNVVEYITDSTEVITNSTITVNSSVITLYPSPTGSFYFNLKELITSLINQTNYTDDLETDLDSSYVYEWSSRVFLSAAVDITINFDNDTSESDSKTLLFLLSAVNLRDYNKRFPYSVDVDNGILLQPLVEGSNNTYYAKYFAGYPFDVTCSKEGSGLNINNATNGLDFDFDVSSIDRFPRIVFSDGRTTSTIEDVLPLVEGLNLLDFDSDLTERFFLNLEKEVGCDGIYIKWLNKSGGYSYWLFKNNNGIRGYKEKGYLNNDFNNLEDTINPEVSLGIDSKDTINLYDSILTEDQKNLIATMLDSPKIYLFTGTPFSQNNFNDWVEVKQKQRNYTIKQVKRNIYNVAIRIELPINYNITV